MSLHKKLDASRIDDIYPLTSLQMGMLFHYLSDQSSDIYLEQIALAASEINDSRKVIRAWESVVSRHESLRSVFYWEDISLPIHIILKDKTLVWQESDEPDSCVGMDVDTVVRKLAENDRRTPFDLSENTFKISIYRRKNGQLIILVSFHHIILDGWSTGIIMNEFVNAYMELCDSKPETKADKAMIRLSGYFDWYNRQEKDRQQINNYWVEYLKNFNQATNIPSSNPTLSDNRVSENRYDIELDHQLRNTIGVLLNNKHVTFSDLIFSAWGLVLQKYNDTDDVVFGTSVSGRTHEVKDADILTGLMINTIPVRITAPGDMPAGSLVQRIHSDMIESIPFHAASLAQVQKLCGFHDSRLFNTIVVVDNYPFDKSIITNSNIHIEYLSFFEKNEYNLTLQVTYHEGINVHFHYNEAMYHQTQIERLGTHFLNTIRSICENPDGCIKDIPMLGSDELGLLNAWNADTVRSYDRHKTISAFFEKTVENHAKKIAVVCGDKKLTYEELNRKSNRLARYMIQEDVKQGDNVIIAVERSVEMVVALLATIKVGAVCVPIDLTYPDSRNDDIIKDSGSLFMLCDGERKFSFFSNKQIDCRMSLEGVFSENLGSEAKSGDTAVLLYTSGSTGKQKGVMLHHMGIINHVLTKANVLGIEEYHIVCNTFSPNVVASLWQIFTPLLLGGQLVIYPANVEFNPYELYKMISNDKINFFQTIPSQLEAYINLLDEGGERINFPDVKAIALTSEPTTPSLARAFYRYYDVQLVNCYGQTECCDDTLHYIIPIGTKIDRIFVGKPSFNTKAYILDRNLSPQLIGVTGELYILGDGVSRGYYKDQEKTQKSFIKREDGNIYYRTGDLARWSEDGNIECLGRTDHQVKIRGNRVELGEIENEIKNYPNVKTAAAIIRETAVGKHIHAFVVSNEVFSASKMRLFLRSRLPEYSMPAVFTALEKMPNTPNGKINRRELLALAEQSNVQSQTETYIKPETNLEKLIKRIWSSILERDEIGTSDNFFDVGGHSLLLFKLRYKINDELKCDLSLADLTQYTTIASQAVAALASLGKQEVQSNEIEYGPEAKPGRAQDGVAIIGMSGRFPRAENVNELWNHIVAGMDCVSSFEDAVMEEHDNYVGRWGDISGIEYFDADFFNMSPREAEFTDPQQRFFLMCAWEAMEDAGYTSDKKTNVGVYGASGISTYLLNNILSNPELAQRVGEFQTALGNDKDFIATKTSYKLDLTGPSITVQTACSASLSAVHMAYQDVLAGKCEMALAGGVYIRTPQNRGYIYDIKGNGAPDGICKAFDASANGTVMGNGAGVILLKKASAAIADGDNIYAIIRGSAMNNDGAEKLSYTAPSVTGQAGAIQEAIRQAGIPVEAIGYVETHGTGTELGDLIELTALKNVFAARTNKKNFCALGSVKTCIGHLDVAAGVTGLIKTAFMLNKKILPPSLHFQLPNMDFDFINSPFYVNTSKHIWEEESEKRYACVSSFGIGGTNVHIVLEEGTRDANQCSDDGGSYLIALSARSEEALSDMIGNLALYISEAEGIDLGDVAYTLQVGRKRFEKRKAFICCGKSDAIRQLSNYTVTASCDDKASQLRSPIALVFGTGGLDRYDADYLMKKYPSYRKSVDECLGFLRQDCGIDLRGRLNDELAIFIYQLAFADLLSSSGVRLDYVCGFGTGRYTALCVSGWLTPQAALKRLTGKGADVGYDITKTDIKYISALTGRTVVPDGSVNISLELSQKKDEDYFIDCVSGINKGEARCFLIGSQTGERVSEKLICDIIGMYWESCGEIDWRELYGDSKRRRVSLPVYPFRKNYFWLEPNSDIPVEPKPKPEVLTGKEDISNWFYVPIWKQSKNIQATRSVNPERCWVVFDDQSELCKSTVQLLEEAGYTVVSIRPANGFSGIRDVYTIDVKREEDYYLLIENILSYVKIGGIVHFWSQTVEVAGDFDGTQEYGFFNIIYLLKALSKENVTNEIDLLLVTNGLYSVHGSENLRPERATLQGLCKVIPQEHSNINCRLIDMDYEGGLGEAKTLVGEIVGSYFDSVVAYRNHVRWIRDFERVNPGASGKSMLNIEDDGVYVFIGGFGQIGRAFTRFIAEKARVKIVLLSRTIIPGREQWNGLTGEMMNIVKHIEVLEGLGTQVFCRSMDVTNQDEVRETFDQIFRIHNNRLDAVFFLAGLTGIEAISAIADETVQKCRKQFITKAPGLNHVADAINYKGVGLLLIVSSLCSLMGGLGSAAYASANAYADAYAQWGEKKFDFPIVSVNWEAWMDENKEQWLALNQYAISTRQGMDMLGIILKMGGYGARLVTSTGDISVRMDSWSKKGITDEAFGAPLKTMAYHKRKLSQESYVAPRNHMDAFLCELWGEFLGIEGIGIEDNFFEMGGHSLTVTRIITKIRSLFHIEIPIKSLFEYPTIISFSNAIADLCGGSNVCEQMAEAYFMVSAMSEDELSAALTE